MSAQEIIVSIELNNKLVRVGILWFHRRNAKESASFEYDKQWLVHPERFALEPALTLTEGTFHTKTHKTLFGSIGDSAPDRWGRVLMRRAHIANNDNALQKTLSELDYLLGVNDLARQGALRFSLMPKETDFLASKGQFSIPPLIALPKLLTATERFIAHDENRDDLTLLLAPGSSMGGARPKAAVIDENGQLAIAKFPKKDDELNVVLWEAVALTLAKMAGICTPAWQIKTILGKPILIIQRFDRIRQKRIPFLSAMSMLDAQDNEQHSYLEIAYALAQHSAEPTQDMQALWRRIVFTIMIANTDDHLRNHGFLYTSTKGWRLSPAYDLNPTPLTVSPNVLTTAIDFDNTAASLDTAMAVASEFQLTHKAAHQIIDDVSLAVKQWPTVAKRLGLSSAECDTMRSAFNLATL